jgi:hypothetical protein
MKQMLATAQEYVPLVVLNDRSGPRAAGEQSALVPSADTNG